MTTQTFAQQASTSRERALSQAQVTARALFGFDINADGKRVDLSTSDAPSREPGRELVLVSPEISLDQRAASINDHINKALRADGTGHRHRLKAGRELMEVRAILSHGEWLPWCKANIYRGVRDVQKLIKMASAPDPEAALEQERADKRVARAASNTPSGAYLDDEAVVETKGDPRAKNEREAAEMIVRYVPADMVEPLLRLMSDSRPSQLRGAVRQAVERSRNAAVIAPEVVEPEPEPEVVEPEPEVVEPPEAPAPPDAWSRIGELVELLPRPRPQPPVVEPEVAAEPVSDHAVALAAEKFDVPEDEVRMAVELLESGRDDLVREVEADRMTLDAAIMKVAAGKLAKVQAEPATDFEKKMAIADSEEVGIPEGHRLSQLRSTATIIRKAGKKHGAVVRPDVAAIAAEIGLPVSPRAAA